MTTVPHILTMDLHRLGEDSRVAGNEHGEDRRVEIEELISKALHLRSRLDQRHEEWAVPVRAGSQPFEMEVAKRWQAAYQQWADDARQIIREARVRQKLGEKVERVEELREALARCDYDGVDIEQLIRNAEELEAGRGVSIEEIRDEIQRRLRG